MSKFEKNKLFAVWIAKEFTVVAKNEIEAREKTLNYLNIDGEKLKGAAIAIGEIDIRFEKQPLRRADIK